VWHHAHLVSHRHSDPQTHNWGGDGAGSSGPGQKKRIDQASQEAAGRALWNQDEAGPYHAIPQPGEHGHPVGTPHRLPHAYQRGDTATMLTLFRPATGMLRAAGVLSAPNAVLHPWLQEPFLQERTEIERRVPAETVPPEAERPPAARWETWLGHPPPRPLPPVRLIVIWDTLAGHRTTAFVDWLLDHGVMPLSTPLSGSWLNMAESVQRIIVPRALAGQHPQNPHEIIDWLEQTVAGWNRHPTPFVWNGTRRRRRERATLRRLAGSGAALHVCNPYAR
jgi:hypothetical protein